MIDQAKQLGSEINKASGPFGSGFSRRGFDISELKNLPKIVSEVSNSNGNLINKISAIRDRTGLYRSIEYALNASGGALVKSIVTDAALTVGSAAVAGVLGTIAASVTMASVNAVIKAVKENKNENKQNSKKE